MDKDYKKLYEEALERAKYLKENTDSVGAKDISYNFEYIFPELRESEDERIRKEIISFITDRKNWFPKEETKSSWISWLEKQKPVEWSKEDDEMLQRIISDCESKYVLLPNEVDWLKSIKPNHWKPSEQNIKDLEWCADLVKDKMGVGFHRLQVFIDDLKQL